MKNKLGLLIAAVALTSSIVCDADDGWNIYGGGSLSHMCEQPWVSSDKSYGWGGGAFIGGGYEFNLTPHWSITPQVELGYMNNGATLSSGEMDFYGKHANWLETWSINIPVTASFRFHVSDDVKLRIGAGPYLQEAIAGRAYRYDSETKETLHGSMGDRFNIGVNGEAAVETGDHLSYFFRTQYPFLTEGWIRKTVTLSVGIKYTF